MAKAEAPTTAPETTAPEAPRFAWAAAMEKVTRFRKIGNRAANAASLLAIAAAVAFTPQLRTANAARLAAEAPITGIMINGKCVAPSLPPVTAEERADMKTRQCTPPQTKVGARAAPTLSRS
jgi:hypothetical protein